MWSNLEEVPAEVDYDVLEQDFAAKEAAKVGRGCCWAALPVWFAEINPRVHHGCTGQHSFAAKLSSTAGCMRVRGGGGASRQAEAELPAWEKEWSEK